MKTGLVLRLIRFPQKTQCVFKVNPIGRFISAYGVFGLKNNALNDINLSNDTGGVYLWLS